MTADSRAKFGTRVLAGLVACGLAVGALAAGSGAAEARIAAPDEWGFEQVTPVHKGSGNVQSFEGFLASPDGRTLLHAASGPYADAPSESSPLYTMYLATRTPDGWANRGLDPKLDPFPGITSNFVQAVVGIAENQRFVVVPSNIALAPGAIGGGTNFYIRDTATGSMRLLAAASTPLAQAPVFSAQYVKYVAPDGSAVLFVAPDDAAPLLPGAPARALYRWTAADGLQVVSKLPDGQMVSASFAVGFEAAETHNIRNSMPREGGADVVYYGAEGHGVYRWDHGIVSAISRSELPEDDGFIGQGYVRATSSNAEYALITSPGQGNPRRLTADTPSLAPGTPESGTQQILYRYERASDRLRYVGVSDVATISESEQMSPDGRSIVFKTRQQLTPDAAPYYGANDPQNRMNYYLWRDGSLQHVASFPLTDPPSFNTGGPSMRLLSDNGRFLAFADSSQENASRFGVADNTSLRCRPAASGPPALCDQMYRYDVERRVLECVSCRPTGEPPRGHSGLGITRQILGRAQRIVADDGTVFFTSDDDLVAEDHNGRRDAYEFREGRLRLLVPPTPDASSRLLDATPDGSSVFVATKAQLTETDTDRSEDIYVTRRGAGFAYEEPPPALVPCTGSDCRDEGDVRRGGDGPLGGSSAPLGGLPARPALPAARVRVTRIVRRKGSLRVSVRTAGVGELRLSGSRVRRTSRRSLGAGVVTISVPLTAKARSALRRNGRIRVRIRVSFAPPFGRVQVVQAAPTVR